MWGDRGLVEGLTQHIFLIYLFCMNQEPTLKDILHAIEENRDAIQENRAVIDFLKDNMATKDDIGNVRREIKEVKNEMIEHVDGFIALYQKHEVELAAVVARQNRLEEKLDTVIKHLGLQLA